MNWATQRMEVGGFPPVPMYALMAGFFLVAGLLLCVLVALLVSFKQLVDMETCQADHTYKECAAIRDGAKF